MPDQLESSESVDSNKKSVARRLYRLVGGFVVLILILFGVSNLLLSSSWATGLAQSKLKEKTGQDWDVGSMTWSPWNGVSINHVVMLQPEPLRAELDPPVIVVDRIRVIPYWTELIRGKARPREVILESPELTLSVEMLAALAARMAPAKIEAAQPERPKPTVNPEREKSTPPAALPLPREGNAQAKHPKPSPTSPSSPGEQQRPPAGLPIRLKVVDASIRIVSVSKNAELLHIERASLDMPVLGEDSEGSIQIALLQIPGLPAISNLEQKLVWKRPYLELEEQTVDAGGVRVRFLAQLGFGRSASGRFPFLIDFAVDKQPIKSVSWFERLALEARARTVAGRVRMNGSLPNPMTWRADVLFIGEKVVVKEIHGRHDVVFDEVYLPAVLRQGQLRWNGVRLIGEDISVLGNGRVSVDGVLALTRLVVSPEVAAMLDRGLHGAKVVPNRYRWWNDLDTPDRQVRDLLVSGSLAAPMVDAGHKKANLPVWHIVLSIFNFVREEMKEEGTDLKPLPNKELLSRKKL